VTSLVGGAAAGVRDGFGTNVILNNPSQLAIATDGKIYVADYSNKLIRLVDTAGYCPSGYFSATTNSYNCTISPAGYFKPKASFSDNYYICAPGTYSVAGASVCTTCPYYTTSAGATICTTPTSQPSSQPSSRPSSQPTKLPTSQPSNQPSSLPSLQPTAQPSSRPTLKPTSQPTMYPSRQPSGQPTGIPSSTPTNLPSSFPTVVPSCLPSSLPSSGPSSQPTEAPSSRPSSQPSTEPSGRPSVHPTSQPSPQPSTRPSVWPSTQPSGWPSRQPTSTPSCQPTSQPTVQPSSYPTAQPTSGPSVLPSSQPTSSPTSWPSSFPSQQPTAKPTTQPSSVPTSQPSHGPSGIPTTTPSGTPTSQPSCKPSVQPTNQPSADPSAGPSTVPSSNPSCQPSLRPSCKPTSCPTDQPTSQPSAPPTSYPTGSPSGPPSSLPSCQPSAQPTASPSTQPTTFPSVAPTAQPSACPTQSPSAQPSARPTQKPTGQPSGLPSAQPMSWPSRQPSRQPTTQPSTTPTVLPTMMPSRQPSSQPTKAPRAAPTGTPTNQPTADPSGQPSLRPTTKPSRKPSAQPSRQPSSRPSARPSTAPSTQPSRTPTSQPTVLPSSRPSRRPTISPSAQPTSRPTALPSAQPTSRPTKRPSTSKPTTQPSARPSVRPSLRPSGQPTRQPASYPSSRPSGQPTSRPIAIGSTKTSRPTPSPTKYPTARPSTAPTAIPTLPLSVQWTSRLTSILSELGTLISSSSIVYSEVLLKGVSLETCSDWNSFYSLFVTASISKQLLKFTLAYSDSLTSTPSEDTVVSCSRIESLALLQEFGVNGSTTAISCGANIWTIATCSGSLAVCVNCSNSGNNVSYVNIFSPCVANSSCFTAASVSDKTATVARVLIATFGVVVPAIVTVDVPVASTSSVTVIVRLDQYGAAYCAAFFPSFTPTAVQQIISHRNSGWTVDNAVNVTLTSLAAATHYIVYCVTMSTKGQFSDISSALAARKLIKTSCCKLVTFSLVTKSVFATLSVPKLAVISFSSLPTIGLTVSLTAFHSNNTGNYSASIVFPATLAIAATSPLSSSVSYIGAVQTGNYRMVLTLSGDDADDFAVVYSNGNSLTITGEASTPLTPALNSAQFSEDGSFVVVGFDSQTDKGQVSNVNSFTCSLLMEFSGASLARCQWSIDATKITVTPSSSYPLSVGSEVRVMPNRIRAACPSIVSISTCKSWPATSNLSGVYLQAPASPKSPVVPLSLPTSIGSCDDLILDYGSSTGSGGRAWASINISLTSTTSANTSGLLLYVKSRTSTSNQIARGRIIIPNGLLSKGYFYAFTVRLCNFLGACGSSTSSVSVLNMAIPSVTIVGGSSFSTTANRSLSLASYAYTANCDGSKSVLNLLYTWSIFLLNGSSSTSLSLTSTSKDPSKYSLGAFALTPRYAYSIQVLVVNLVSLKSSAAACVVTVPQSDLIVMISGGSHLSLRLLNTFTADASGSFDSDQSNKGKVGLQYSWRCYQTSPTYAGTCPLFLGLTNSSVVGGYANATSANTSSDLLLSVYDVTRSASGEVMATVLSATAPLVTILTQSTDDLLPSSSFTLTALVTASNANSYLECLWSVDDSSIDLYSLSYVSPIQVVSVATVKTSSVYLSLGPNVLSAGATFTFSLACDAVTSDSASAASSSVASVVVTTNSPPTLGVFSVSPLQGLELATTFSMSARFWVDADTPISYEFGFVSPSTGAVFVLQSKGLQSLASAYLPAGSSAVNSSLTTYVEVFDSLRASVLEYVSVQVASVGLNETNINSKTTSFMALVGGNVDGMKQVFSVVVNTLTAVNCSQAPNCSALNRFDCMATPHTCGSCISSSYVGINGDSNEKCVAISAFSIVDAGTTACEDDSDCALWSTCDTSSRECVPALKSCSGNCTATENGHCKFVRTGNLQFLATCLVSDPSCEAICICSPGYYGEDCSADEVRLVANQDTTDTLAASLLNVKELETLDSQSAVFWANALQALTTKSIYLTTTSSSIAYNISLVLLHESSALTDATLTTLSAVVDNILGISTTASGRRRLMSSETAVNATAISSIMDTLAVVLTGQMVPNQQPQTSILSNYRIAAHVITPSTDTSTNFTVTAPVTSLESASNTTVSSMSVSNPNALFGDQTENNGVGIGLGLVSLPEYLIDMSSYINSTVNASMTSNGFRLTLNSELQKADVTLAISSTKCNETSFTFSFAHYSAESFGAVGNATKILTTCTAGVTSTSNISCPSGGSAKTLIVPVLCNGSLPTHTVVTTCPQLQRLPSCAVSTSADTISPCDVVNYTSVMTTCRCSGCLFTSTASESTASRKLASTSSNAYSTGILALSVHSFTEYASVMESASAFNSVSALRDTILIVATFAVLWIGTLIAACSMQSTHSAAKKYVVQNNKSSSLKSVAPHADEGVNNLPVKGTSRKSSLTADASLQPNSLEECLKEYIYELFSPAFSDETETVRFMRELWNKHEYFSVFAQEEFGTEQWISLFCLLTNLNANFFLLAFFYDIQFASDDGTCRLYASSAECESPKSMFNPAQSKCSWQVRTYSTDTYECVWQQPQIVIYTTIIVFLIALAVSAPITFAISCICEMVLMAPAVSEVEQRDAVNKTRRQSAMLMMNNSKSTSKSTSSIGLQ
jgi:hypothetical protein